MNDIALTPEYLEHLLALGKAVPAGPWGTSLNAFELFGKDFTDWGEVYANLTLDNGHVFKGSVIAHANTNLIPEEEKLAAREAYLKGEKVDPGLSGKLAAYIAAYHPGVTTALIMEILRLRAEVERLEREAEWLANHCREFCESYSYCGECPMFSGWLSCAYADCGEAVSYRGEKHTALWREAARKAVEESA